MNHSMYSKIFISIHDTPTSWEEVFATAFQGRMCCLAKVFEQRIAKILL